MQFNITSIEALGKYIVKKNFFLLFKDKVKDKD